MTDHTRQFVEHHPETYARKYCCPWCEKDFIAESENDCPDGCGHKCWCGAQASAYVELFGEWICEYHCNMAAREICKTNGGD